MKKNFTKIFRILGVLLFIYIIFRINFGAALEAIQKMNLGFFLLCIFFSIFGLFIRIAKWQILTSASGARVSFKELTDISLKSFFWGVITPGKLGEFLRAKYLSDKTGISNGVTFFTAFMDRIADILITILIGFIGFCVIYYKFGKLFDWRIPAVIIFVAIMAGYYLIKRKGLQNIIITVVKFLTPSFLKEKTSLFMSEFFQAFKVMDLKVFLKILSSSFFYYLIGGPVVHYFLALALGISIPFWYLFLMIAVVWLILILPVSVLGLGTREAGFIYFFSLLGISSSLAVAFSLSVLIVNILIALPGAVLFLKQK